jgi:hypothetical protein
MDPNTPAGHMKVDASHSEFVASDKRKQSIAAMTQNNTGE